MIKYIHFADFFDAARLKREVQKLESGAWKDHYNRSNYTGSWSTLQLRSINGSLDNNTAIHAGALQGEHVFKDSVLMNECPYIKEVVDHFKMEKTTIRLMKLEAGANIKPHRDPGLNFEEGEVRIHIPVITNPQLHFFLESDRLIMEEGSCWYLNLALQHCVRNEGSAARVHLVIDGIVNDGLQAYFAQPQHKAVYMTPPLPGEHSREDKIKIIAQLRQMKTDTGNRLADEMEDSLQ